MGPLCTITPACMVDPAWSSGIVAPRTKNDNDVEDDLAEDTAEDPEDVVDDVAPEWTYRDTHTGGAEPYGPRYTF